MAWMLVNGWGTSGEHIFYFSFIWDQTSWHALKQKHQRQLGYSLQKHESWSKLKSDSFIPPIPDLSIKGKHHQKWAYWILNAWISSQRGDQMNEQWTLLNVWFLFQMATALCLLLLALSQIPSCLMQWTFTKCPDLFCDFLYFICNITRAWVWKCWVQFAAAIKTEN